MMAELLARGASPHYDGDGRRAAETYSAQDADLMVRRMRRNDAYRTADPLPERAAAPWQGKRQRRRGALAHTAWNERFPR